MTPEIISLKGEFKLNLSFVGIKKRIKLKTPLYFLNSRNSFVLYKLLPLEMPVSIGTYKR